MATILLVGATGLVGRHVMERALADGRVDRLVAPTRRPLPSHPKLFNPLVDFQCLPGDADWWSVDGAICALGTTRAKAGWATLEYARAIRTVDHDYPLAVARLVRGRDAACFALTSTMGANAGSRFLYTRTKGELEERLKELRFPSLTLVRPGLIGGQRDDARATERIAGAILGTLAPLLPRHFRINPAERIAEVLTDAAVEGPPGCQVVEAGTLAGPNLTSE